MNDNIVILGAGLSGEITALAFASKGIKTLILEATDLNFPHDRRTTALTNFSINYFKEIGILEPLKKYLANIDDIYVVDNFSPNMVHLSESKSDALGYMVENHDFREKIHELVLKNPLIDLKKSVDYKMENGILKFGDNSMIPDLLIICDGRNSKIRKDNFTDSFYKDYKQSAIIFNVSHDKKHENTAIEHFMPRGPFAILPLVSQNESGIVWTENTDVASIYKNMPKDELLVYLKERFGEFLGNIEIISDVQVYPLSARITKNYYKDNMVLIADSAHNVHPLAGQGLNQGIKDIESLVSIVSRNLKLGLKIDDIALNEYENSRKLDNYAMYFVTDNLNRFFSNNLWGLRSLRKIGLSIVDKISVFKRFLVK